MIGFIDAKKRERLIVELVYLSLIKIFEGEGNHVQSELRSGLIQIGQGITG